MTYSQFAKQNVTVSRKGQVQNNAGGFSFPVDNWKRLLRFLILGSVHGTYYTSPTQLTLDNVTALIECLREDERRAVEIIVDVSVNNRAAKLAPSIFAFAIASSPNMWDNRGVAMGFALHQKNFNAVLRTASHLFEYLNYITEFKMRGWGSMFKTAVANWYLSKNVDQVAYQMVKYQQRYGWSHRDVLRSAHPEAISEQMNNLFHWAVNGTPTNFTPIIDAFETAKTAKTIKEILEAIDLGNLPMEAVPTQWLKEKAVWNALLEKMPMHALVRNLANMTRHGVLEARSDSENKVLSMLADPDHLRKSRMHPLAVYLAKITYSSGRGASHTWTPNRRVNEALEDAFYLCYGNVEASNADILIGIDVSGSMRSKIVSGTTERIYAAEAAAAQALVIANVEKYADSVVFNDTAWPFEIDKRTSISQLRASLPIGGNTDCGAPIKWALANNKKYDMFVILTDSETWYNGSHPYADLVEYRRHINPQAKMATVAMAANGFSLNSPEDANSIDLIGFDANTPTILSNFALNKI